MKETLGVILASTLLVSGCSSIESEMGMTPTINVGNLPSDLPESVAQQVGNVISVDQNIQASNNGMYGHCSGVEITPSLDLSAGHCGIIPSDFASLQYSDTLTVTDITNQTKQVDEHAITYSDPASNLQASDLKKDIMLMQTNPVATSPSTHISSNSEHLAPGTSLFAVNYETTADHETRSPSAEGALVQPAMFGAIVLNYLPSGIIEAISGVKAYGSANDPSLREGGSGGPIFDENGDLVGLSTAVETNAATIGDIDHQYNVSLSGIPDDATANVIFIQPVTSQTISELQPQLK